MVCKYLRYWVNGALRAKSFALARSTPTQKGPANDAIATRMARRNLAKGRRTANKVRVSPSPIPHSDNNFTRGSKS